MIKTKTFIATVREEGNPLLDGFGKISTPELKNYIGCIVKVEIMYLGKAGDD